MGEKANVIEYFVSALVALTKEGMRFLCGCTIRLISLYFNYTGKDYFSDI